MRRGIARGAWALGVLIGLACAQVWGASLTPEIQRAVRTNTFEVVVKKPEHDPLTYEHALPLDLLPYLERTDPYRSIGTAVALGHNRYATAAHVLTAAVGSQYGAPMLRALDGTVHAVAEVLTYSSHEDFAVFSIAQDPLVAGLEVNRSPASGELVFAVGNALGDGIVIRDGLYTSDTPEEQEGAWKWIRFSAAASPGNSGGPLLDADGRMIGLVIAKSENENLNYALPIARVLDAPPGRARITERWLVRSPTLAATSVYRVKDEFALPLEWSAFARTIGALFEKHHAAARAQLQREQREVLFPKGTGVESILYEVPALNSDVAQLSQLPNGDWTLQSPELTVTRLPGDGTVRLGGFGTARIVVIKRGNEASDAAFYADARRPMDLALSALDLRRQVGSDAVRVTSLGSPELTDALTDRWGRRWQLFEWPLPFLDEYLLAAQLPTPEGSIMLIDSVDSLERAESRAQITELCDALSAHYRGTLAQWKAYLGRSASLPEPLRGVQLEERDGWRLHTGRFDLQVPPALLALGDHSRLTLAMGFLPHEGGSEWGVAGARIAEDSRERAGVTLWRHVRPPASAEESLRNQYEDLYARRAPFDGQIERERSDVIASTHVIDAPGSTAGTRSTDLLYTLAVRTGIEHSVDETRTLSALAQRATIILEHGAGAEAPAAIAPSPEERFREGVDRFMQQLRASEHEHEGDWSRDLRGRTLSQDAQDYLATYVKQTLAAPISSIDGPAVMAESQRRFNVLTEYWKSAAYLVKNRDLWTSFLTKNHLSADTPHSPAVLAAEARLRAVLSEPVPTDDWGKFAGELLAAYTKERKDASVKVVAPADLPLRARRGACPAPVAKTSGLAKPRYAGTGPSPGDFYPMSARRQALEGYVVVRFRVNTSGCVTATAVSVSSGDDELDESALQWVEASPFLPAEAGGQPVESQADMRVNFKLD